MKGFVNAQKLCKCSSYSTVTIIYLEIVFFSCVRK